MGRTSKVTALVAALFLAAAACGDSGQAPATSSASPVPSRPMTAAPATQPATVPPSSSSIPTTTATVPPDDPRPAWPGWATTGVAIAEPGTLAPTGDVLPAGAWVEAALADQHGIVYVTWPESAPAWRLVAAPAAGVPWQWLSGGDMNVLAMFRAASGAALIVEPIRSADRNGAAGFIVNSYDADRHELTRAATFSDSSFSPAQAVQLDGTRLGLWGSKRSSDGIFGTLRLVVYDWQRREAIVNVTLDDVAVEPEVAFDVPFLERLVPAVVWDVERERAIVVHADREAVTTVSYRGGKVETHDLTEARSLVEAFLSWLVPPAHAKGLPASERSAVISGDRLHVAGSATLFEEVNGQLRYRLVPTGIFSVDLASLEIVARNEVPVTRLAVVGDVLLAYGSSESGTVGEFITTVERSSSGLVVLDAAGLEVLAVHDLPGGGYYEVDVSGDYAYVSTGGRAYALHAPTGAITRLDDAVRLYVGMAGAGLRYVPVPGS